MMEAKDTITSACALCSSATNQAEIAFKAGQQQGFGAGVYAGRKEVVVFIQDRLQRYKVAPKLLGFTMLSEDWRAKLKEWGFQSPSGVEEK